MFTSSHPSLVRTRNLSAALIALGCSLGVTIAPDAQATEHRLQYCANEHCAKGEHFPHTEALKTDQATVDADQTAISKFEKSLTPETAKLPANKQKLQAMKATLQADQRKLQADQNASSAGSKK